MAQLTVWSFLDQGTLGYESQPGAVLQLATDGAERN